MSKNYLLRWKLKGCSGMSLILDALNRAEHERKNQNAVPDLNTLHRPQILNAESNSRRTLWWAITAALVLSAIAIVLAILMWAQPEEQVSAKQAAVVNTVPVQQSPVAPSPIAQQPISTVTAAPTPAPTQAAVVATAAEASASNADINKLYSAEDVESPVVADTGVSELYAAEAATTAASETIVDPFNANATNSDSVAAAALQEQAPPRTFDSIKNIPDFNALPWNMRQQIPTISYARHDFLAGGVSSVVINNQTTGVGNIIGTGQFVVQEIFVDGVVLKHGNAVFKLRALTGWINM